MNAPEFESTTTTDAFGRDEWAEHSLTHDPMPEPGGDYERDLSAESAADYAREELT